MTETYTRTIPPQGAAKKSNPDAIRLDVDDQLFYEMLKSELDALLRQPQSRSISKITSYSRIRRMPLV